MLIRKKAAWKSTQQHQNSIQYKSRPRLLYVLILALPHTLAPRLPSQRFACVFVDISHVRVYICTSPSSLKANAALSLVVTDAIRRPHSAAALLAAHRPAKGLVLLSSSGSTWLSWLSVNTSFSMEVSPSADSAGSLVFDESGGGSRGGRGSGWLGRGSLYIVAFVELVHESDVTIARSSPPPLACISSRNPTPYSTP